MSKRIFLVAAIIVALGLTTTAIQANAALPRGCTGDPHDGDAPTANPHDFNPDTNHTETGNPHDAGHVGGGHHHEGADICPGAQ